MFYCSVTWVITFTLTAHTNEAAAQDQPGSAFFSHLQMVRNGYNETKLQLCCVTVTSVTCCHAVIDYEINVSPWAMFAHRVNIAASLSRLFVVAAAVVLLLLVLVLCLFV